MRKRIVLVLASAFLLTGCARGEESIPQKAAETIRKNHPAPYTTVTKVDFDAQGEELIRNWDALEAQSEAGFALSKWVASLGDEHTQVVDTAWFSIQTPFYVMPVEGKYMLVQGQECAKPYLGWVISAIGDMPIEKIESALAAYISFETEGWLKAQTAQKLASVAMLKKIGATDLMDALSVTLCHPETGEEQNVSFESVTTYDYSTSTLMPLADTLLQGGTYRAYLLNEGTLFIQYNQCANDVSMPMKDFAAALESQLTAAPEKIIVDLRHNGGGDSSVIKPLIQLLQKFEKQGSRLYTLIGGETFSSAVMNAADLREIGAVLVGETTGGTIGFGEVKTEELTDTLYLMYSTKDFAHGKAHEPVQPDILAPQTLFDFTHGIDTAVQAILTE